MTRQSVLVVFLLSSHHAQAHVLSMLFGSCRYNAGRGGQWPPRGRGFGTSGGGGFGGGGKWKHDMFEELVKDSSVPKDTNLTQAPATASPGTHVEQKAAEPSQLS